MKNSYHNIRKSNAPPLVRGKPSDKPKARSSKLEAQSLKDRGWPLLYQLSIYPDRERGDPAHDPVLETSVKLCVVSALSAVKNETETGKQNFAGQHRLPNKGRPQVLHPGLSGFGGGMSDVKTP